MVVATRLMTIETCWILKTVGDIAYAPDGTGVVAVESQFDRSRDVVASALRLYSVQGDASSVVVARSDAALSSPAWSNDGRLAVIADGDIVVTDPNQRREPRRYGVGIDVEEFAWFPDGTALVLVAKPPATTGAANVVVIDVLRHKTREDGWFDGRYRHLWILDLESSALRQVTSGPSSDRNPIVSRQGDLIAFASDRAGDPDHDRPMDIWLISTGESAAMRKVTSSDGEYFLPSFSHDGTRLAFLGHRGALGDESANTRVWIISLDDGQQADLLGDWDGTAADVLLTETRAHAPGRPPLWSADDTRLAFVGSFGAASNLFQVAAVGGSPIQLTGGDHEIAEATFAADSERYAVLRTSTSEPPDIWLVDSSRPLTRLTDINGAVVAEHQFVDHERIRFVGHNGLEIEGFLVRPPSFSNERRYPVIVRIAGGPHLAYGSSFVDEVQLMAARGYVVFYCNPRGTQSYGQEHARAVVGDWCGRDALDIMAGVDYISRLSFVDPARIGVTGASYGGLMVNWLVTQTDRFAVAVSQRSISNLYSFSGAADRQNGAFEFEFGGVLPYEQPDAYLNRSPLWHVASVTTPLLLIQAGEDYITPVTQAEEFYVALKRLGRVARLIVYPKEQHYVRRYGQPSSRMHYIESHLAWLDQYLQPSDESGE
jgi:dipeptidyl aminopeptidase/acylaminoacyl peptidase